MQYVNIWICGKIKINLICIYRHQEESYQSFLSDLDSLLSAQKILNHSIMLAGDFNFHYENSDTNEVLSLENLLNSYGLTQFVQGPTHNKGHTLDLLWSNQFEFNFPIIEPISHKLSDHFPVFFNIPNNSINIPVNNQTAAYRDIKSIDIDVFKCNLRNSLNNVEFSEDLEFEDHFNLYSEALLSELDKAAPLQSRPRPPSAPELWMDREFKDLRATRRKLEKRWKRSGLDEDKSNYVKKKS